MQNKLNALAVMAIIKLEETNALSLDSQADAAVEWGNEWRSGEVMTWETYKYGKFIAKIKGDDKKGTCTSFFTFWKGDSTEEWSYYGWSELDDELVPSDRDGTFSTNIIWSNMSQNHDTLDLSIADPQDNWHTYEMQWTPDYVKWLYDGEIVRSVTNDASVEWLHDREQHLMMNFWIPAWENWNRDFDPVEFPWYARYDFVEVWDYVPPEQWDTTEGANEYHPFEFSWRDDFNSFDDSRWKKSENWSFNDNLVTFMESNVYTEDGNLVLKLEPKSWTPAPFPDPDTDPDTDPVPEPTPNPTPTPDPTPIPSNCENYEVERAFYPGNEDYQIGSSAMIIDLASFTSSTEFNNCWDYSIRLLTSLPTDDADCIQFDNIAREATVYSTKASSAGDYHIRIEANDRATGETKVAHQIKIGLLPPADGYVPPNTDNDDQTPQPEPTCSASEIESLQVQIAAL